MSYADRISLISHYVIFLLAIYLTVKAFGPAKRHDLSWHLEKNHLELVGGLNDAEFVIKTSRPLTDKAFRALIKDRGQYFSTIE
ncbi:hypothetical protein [Pseudomonas viridiflava]|uniref:hypothetical protein n=1 Tax=Pseudomonas viridiflava TaxID=33069 RepID=UPI000F03EC08|nr:hypothetical protein [Pseudomonas viridiflava]